MLNRRADKLELLRIADAVALEKSIDRELIINSMEMGIAKAAKSKFGQENEIKVQIDRKSGNIEIFRKLIIVEKPENLNVEISLQDAQNLDDDKSKNIGDEVFPADNLNSQSRFPVYLKIESQFLKHKGEKYFFKPGQSISVNLIVKNRPIINKFFLKNSNIYSKHIYFI